MVYPAIMFVVGLGVLVFMMTFVIPKVANIFEASNKALPFITVVLIGASDFLRENFVFLLVFLAAVLFFGHRYVRTPSGKKVYDRFSLRIPVFGKNVFKSDDLPFHKDALHAAFKRHSSP